MLEVLPIKLLSEDDALIFGKLNVEFGKLSRGSLSVADGFVVTPPTFKLQTVLNHYMLGNRELIEQSLVLVRKELQKQPIPQEVSHEIRKNESFFVEGKSFSDIQSLWHFLIDLWLDEIKSKIWKYGFSPDLTKNLTPQIVSFVKKVAAYGEAYFDEITGEVVVNIKQGDLDPGQHKELTDIIQAANKKLLIKHSYQWILDSKIKLIGINFYTPNEETVIIKKSPHEIVSVATDTKRIAGVTKVFLDLSNGFVIEKNVDGAFIAAEKIINLNNKDSFEELAFKLTETAKSLEDKKVLFKLPDIPETLGGVRGSLRLLHQESLLNPIVKIIKFLKKEKKLGNVQILIPFLRHSNEYKMIKKKLADEGINQDHDLQFWIEFTVGENLLNIEEYLKEGIDGVVLNLDELIGSLYGFNHTEDHFAYLKKEINGLTKFLGENIKKLKKEKVPVLAYGSLVYDISLLEYLVHEGINGVIVERYEALSMSELLYKLEKKMVLKKLNS